MKNYRLYAVAKSGCLFSPKGNLIIEIDSSHGRTRITYGTNQLNEKGFNKPISNGIFAMVDGPAPDLDSAKDLFSKLADNVAVFVALGNNASIAPFNILYCVNTSNDTGEFEYFVNKHEINEVLPFGRRLVPREECAHLISSFHKHPEEKRLRMAMANYLESLRKWGPGETIISMNHIFIGMEVLTPVVARHEIKKLGINNNQELASNWGIELTDLDSTIRKKILFQGNEKCYKMLKNASDGFEHGFKDIDSISKIADEWIETAAGYLREAILNFLATDQTIIKNLISDPFSKPFTAKYVRAFYGKVKAKNVDWNNLDIGNLFQWEEKIEEKNTNDEYALIHSKNTLILHLPGADFLTIDHKLITFND